MKKTLEKIGRALTGDEASRLVVVRALLQYVDAHTQNYKFGDISRRIASDVAANTAELKRGFEGAVQAITKKEVASPPTPLSF